MTDQTVIPPTRSHRSMSIKGLIPRLPERGRIAIGMKGEMITSRQGNQFQPPQKLDFFRVCTLERGKDGNFLLDTAFHAKYGARPTEIPVRLLFDDPELNFPTRYACYIGRTLWCTGNGEAATRLTETPQALKTPGKIAPREVACPCHRKEPSYEGTADRCKMNGSLQVMIEGMGGIGGVWRLRTTSFNSILNILSSMQFLRSVTSGVLANIPLVLRVQPKQATNPQNPTQSVLIYVVSIEFAGDIAELQQYAHQIALDRATTRISITHIENEARRLLELPAPANVVLPGDDADDVVEEFYPEQVNEPVVDAPPRPTREQFIAPQAPEAEKEEPTPPLSEAEEAELAALVVKGDAAAAGGTEKFTAFWNEGETKAYRKELTPRLEAWGAVARREAPSEPDQDEVYPFEIYDVTGVAYEKTSIEGAVGAYRAFLLESERQNGEAGLTTVWDNNQGLMRELDERGHDALSKELSMEYGNMRQAAAAREQEGIPRGTVPPIQAGAEPAMLQASTDDNPAPTGEASVPTSGGPGPTATTHASPSEVRSNDAAARPGAASVAGAAQDDPSSLQDAASRSPAGDPTKKGKSRSGLAAKSDTSQTGERIEQPKDLLGGTPVEDLMIRLPGTITPVILSIFAEKMCALIDKAPLSSARRTRIVLANEGGLATLRAGAPEQYDKVIEALYRKP